MAIRAETRSWYLCNKQHISNHQTVVFDSWLIQLISISILTSHLRRRLPSIPVIYCPFLRPLWRLCPSQTPWTTSQNKLTFLKRIISAVNVYMHRQGVAQAVLEAQMFFRVPRSCGRCNVAVCVHTQTPETNRTTGTWHINSGLRGHHQLPIPAGSAEDSFPTVSLRHRPVEVECIQGENYQRRI